MKNQVRHDESCRAEGTRQGKMVRISIERHGVASACFEANVMIILFERQVQRNKHRTGSLADCFQAAIDFALRTVVFNEGLLPAVADDFRTPRCDNLAAGGDLAKCVTIVRDVRDNE